MEDIDRMGLGCILKIVEARRDLVPSYAWDEDSDYHSDWVVKEKVTKTLRSIFSEEIKRINHWNVEVQKSVAQCSSQGGYDYSDLTEIFFLVSRLL